MNGSLSDHYSFSRRQSFVPYAPVEGQDESVASESQNITPDETETQELDKIALEPNLEFGLNGELNDEIDQASSDLSEHTNEDETLLRRVHQYLSIPEDK